MIERLKILTLMQLSNKTRLYARGSKRIFTHIAIRALIVIIISIIMSFIFYFIKSVLFIPVNHYFIIFLLMVTQGINMVATISGLSMDLYTSKDNHILLSLPAKNDEIYLSKLIVYYIYEFIRNMFVVIPMLIGFGFVNRSSILYYFSMVLIIIILPLISVLISALISIAVAYFRNFLKKYSILTFIVFLLVFGSAFLFTYRLIGSIQTPIRIVELYYSFVVGVIQFMQNAAQYGTIYTMIGEMIYGIKIFANLGWIILILTSLIFLNYFISKPIYFKLASNSLEHASQKKHRLRRETKKHLFFTFIKKEVTIAMRSPNELITNYAFLMSLPFFLYILNYIYLGINRSSLGNTFVLVFNIMITLLIVLSSNTASATSITTEGLEFGLLKTAPSKTVYVAWAKMAFNFVLSTLVILVSFIIFQFSLPIFERSILWSLFAFIVLVNAGHMLWSFQLDILKPKLADYAATGSLSNNQNVSQALTNGLSTTLFFTLISAILFLWDKTAAWNVMIILAVLFLIYRFMSFRTSLKVYFNDIEY